MRLRKRLGLGLDIGSRKIKLVSLRQNGNRPVIERWCSMPTPPETVDAGIIQDPQFLGESLGELVKELHYKDRGVVAAVSGVQVYTRNLVMPWMKVEEVKEAVKYEAVRFLPIPVEEAAMDVFPLREFEDEEGKKVEVFFVAVRRQQVENLKLVCSIAGLKLKVVEIEPLALHRILNVHDTDKVKAFLNIGASRAYFSVFNDNVLVFNRHLPFGAIQLCPRTEPVMGQYDDEPDHIDITPEGELDILIRDIVSEVAHSVEYYHLQNLDSLDQIILCGGGARIRDLDKLLASGVNCDVQVANPFAGLILPPRIDDHNRRKLQHDFAVALGLAARGILQ